MYLIIKNITVAIIMMTIFSGHQTTEIELSPNWLLDIEKAKEKASKENKSILISFAGSDWCKPCIILTKEVFESERFNSYAKDNLVLVLADFPRYKKNRLPADQIRKNEMLAKQYNDGGAFPFVVIIDVNGKVLGKPAYHGDGVDEYITHLKTLLANQQ